MELIDRSVNYVTPWRMAGGEKIGVHDEPDFSRLFAECAQEAVAARRRTGQQIVGYLGAAVPVELILSAGLLPFRVGPFKPSTSAVEPYLEMGDSDVVAVLAGALLDGSYDFLDFLVIGNSPIFNVTLFHFLRELRRDSPQRKLPKLYLHEVHHGDSAVIKAFNIESCRRLADRLAPCGAVPTGTMLRAAIEKTNQRRMAIARLGALRRQRPSGLEGAKALGLMARWQMSAASVDVTVPSESKALPRVLFSGSDVGHFEHYPVIEAAGCTIVADDHDWGALAVEPSTSLDGDPWEAIAERYAHWPPRAGRWPRAQRIQAVVEIAVGSAVDGLVYWPSEEDQASAWDFPALRSALSKHGIPCLDLGPQPALAFDASAITARTRRWLESLGTPSR